MQTTSLGPLGSTESTLTGMGSYLWLIRMDGNGASTWLRRDESVDEELPAQTIILLQ